METTKLNTLEGFQNDPSPHFTPEGFSEMLSSTLFLMDSGGVFTTDFIKVEFGRH